MEVGKGTGEASPLESGRAGEGLREPREEGADVERAGEG